MAYEDPFEMLAHLMVGSEGTLAFLSEVSMKTLPIAPYKASAMIYFPDMVTAAKAVVAMKGAQVSAAELLDKRSLASVNDPHLKADVPDLTAVLTETQAESPEALQEQIEAIVPPRWSPSAWRFASLQTPRRWHSTGPSAPASSLR